MGRTSLSQSATLKHALEVHCTLSQAGLRFSCRRVLNFFISTDTVGEKLIKYVRGRGSSCRNSYKDSVIFLSDRTPGFVFFLSHMSQVVAPIYATGTVRSIEII